MDAQTTPKREPTKMLQVRVPVSLVDDLRKVAAENDRSVSAELRRAARTYLDQQAKES